MSSNTDSTYEPFIPTPKQELAICIVGLILGFCVTAACFWTFAASLGKYIAGQQPLGNAAVWFIVTLIFVITDVIGIKMFRDRSR